MRKVHKESTLAHSEAFCFVIREWSKMLDAGLADSEICISNSTSVVYVKEGDLVVGAILYSVDMSKRQGWIYMAMVAAEMRNQGIYSALYAEVEKDCKQQGAVTLSSNVHVQNQPMLAALNKHARGAQWLKTKKRI
jgi:hypothetical protein